MRSLLALLLLVPMLSFATPTGGGRKEFCDDHPPDRAPDEINGGQCEVDMVIPDDNASLDLWLHNLRNLKFNAEVLQRLNGGALRLNTKALALNSGTGPEKEEVMLIELSFAPDAGPSAGGHLLAISFLRNEKDAAIRADWLITPDAAWSFADLSGTTLLSEQMQDTDVLPLGSADAATFPEIHIEFDETGVVVSVQGGASRFFAFQAPKAHWAPYRLRNGFVIHDQIKSRIGALLDWPQLYNF